MSDDFEWAWVWDDFDVTLHVSRPIEEFWRRSRQNDDDDERGGQLFANSRDTRGLVLSRVTVPHRRDRSGRNWLELDSRRCREELRVAEREGFRLLGYWHTHPEAIPHVSPQDIASFRAFTLANVPTIPYPICVIVGREQVRAWSIREQTVVEATRVALAGPPVVS